MDLNLTTDELSFRDELRAWLVSNVPKDWNEWREKPIEESFPYLRSWQQKLHDGRWAAVSWPREYGGCNDPALRQAPFLAETARPPGPPTVASLGLGLMGPASTDRGTGAHTKRNIPARV